MQAGTSVARELLGWFPSRLALQQCCPTCDLQAAAFRLVLNGLPELAKVLSFVKKNNVKIKSLLLIYFCILNCYEAYIYAYIIMQ